MMLGLVIFITMTSCGVSNETLAEKRLADCSEIAMYQLVDGFVMYNGREIGYMKSTELAYDNGELVYEASVALYDISDNDKAICIIAAIHKLKPDWDIEVEVERNYGLTK